MLAEQAEFKAIISQFAQQVELEFNTPKHTYEDVTRQWREVIAPLIINYAYLLDAEDIATLVHVRSLFCTSTWGSSPWFAAEIASDDILDIVEDTPATDSSPLILGFDDPSVIDVLGQTVQQMFVEMGNQNVGDKNRQNLTYDNANFMSQAIFQVLAQALQLKKRISHPSSRS